MGKHGKHGTAFSHDFRQHGKAWGAWNSILSYQTAWKSMGSMVQHFLMISESMGKHGKHGNSSFS